MIKIIVKNKDNKIKDLCYFNKDKIRYIYKYTKLKLNTSAFYNNSYEMEVVDIYFDDDKMKSVSANKNEGEYIIIKE